MAGRMINGAAALAELVRAAGEVDDGGIHRVLPVVPELSGLLPSRGLRRGTTVAVATGRAAPASGGTSLLLALLAEASRSGSWCAVVGVPSLGALAAAESGIALDRLALVPNPGPDWPTVVAALIDGVDLVVMAVPGPISASVTSRLVARARQRGSVLVPFGEWSGADVTLRVTDGHWEGVGAGHGRLRRREVTVLARGRGAAARPKEITMWMPGVTVRPITLPPAPAATDDEPTGQKTITGESKRAAGPAVTSGSGDPGTAVGGAGGVRRVGGASVEGSGDAGAAAGRCAGSGVSAHEPGGTGTAGVGSAVTGGVRQVVGEADADGFGAVSGHLDGPGAVTAEADRGDSVRAEAGLGETAGDADGEFGVLFSFPAVEGADVGARRRGRRRGGSAAVV
jgi:hypothetical protein